MRKAIFAIMVILLTALPALGATVSVSKVTADISYSKDYGGVTAGNSLTISLELPCTLESLNNTNNNITITADSATASTTIDLTVNGVAVATNYVITGGSSATWTFVDFANAGVDMSATKLTITVTAVANSTTATVLKLFGDDVNLADNYTVGISEVQLSKPFVAKDYSWYSVKDTVKIIQNSDINLTDVKAYITYPDYAISKPITVYNFGSLNKSEIKSLAISYQKKGPWVTDINTIQNGDYTTVKIRIYSFENLTANFKIEPTEKEWAEYFPEFSPENIINITLNGNKVEYKTGSIIMEDLSLIKGYNVLNITYGRAFATFAPPIEVPTPTPWYLTTEGLLIIVAIAITIVAVVYIVLRKR